ncbi:uncharacterized protein LOC115632136 isoform X2 [Scaptodrosophila lebanonensis]|uniref:Uncharacterized protein LOC115632136 isoform X2 n=1 Tax=Drosophila lebanonensis TaxID=7225 RepID=A0A6J2U936_DROLE|nr:uncharacterized protein LOC115632136 isoform X2 [Scaptodrosophila lebanonensis]
MSATTLLDVKEQHLESSMARADEDLVACLGALELGNEAASVSDNTVTNSHIQSNCNDGSDSGLDIASCCISRVTLERALSSNSGGYTSSNGGLEESSTHTQSQLSCNSDLYELKALPSLSTAQSQSHASYDCCSENGSESSREVLEQSVPKTPVRRVNGSIKKKVAMFEPSPGPSNAKAEEPQRGRVVNLKRAVSLPRHSVGPATLATPTAASTASTSTSREKHRGERLSSASFRIPSTTATGVPTPTRPARPQKPDTLTSALSRTQSISMQRLVQRTPSLSRARTPGTPSDDGRWPTNRGGGSARRGMSVTPDVTAVKMRNSMLASSLGSGGYGTLPRQRKQQSVEDLSGAGSRVSRSNSITRADTRMTASVMVMSSSTRRSLVPSVTAKVNSLRRPQALQRTRIYHETAVQTALTSQDLDQVFNGGVAQARAVDAVEQRNQSTQAEDVRDCELERLRDEIRQLAQREHELSGKLQREREEKLAMQRELHLNTERVMGMLEMARVVGANAGTPTSEDSGDGSGHDSLLMLESQIQMSGHELFERQQEISQLRALVRALQMEMRRSLATQECLIQEKATIEQESSELQDFLQHEKASLCDALKELETENQGCKAQLANREEEAKVLRDECRHLVRLNEQRRQENRLLQTKYSALETKSRELIHQQNASVAGASTALSGLHSRLDSLVEQLVYSYSISEQDLEDIRFQNEAIATEADNSQNGNSGGSNGKPNALDLPLEQVTANEALHTLVLASDGSLSPQRNQSFIAAVISAIRQATTHSGKRLSLRQGGKRNGTAVQTTASGQVNAATNEQTTQNGTGDDSDSTEMLDSETEPCLMMDNVLEDVVHPDSHSHNMVSSCTGMISQIELPTELISQCSQPATTATANGDDSLQQLSQAITNRQQMELHMHKLNVMPINNRDQCNTEDLSCHDSLAELPSLMEYSTAQAVVDQVIEVDTLVTKLLKVLRLVQMDNDNCIQQLIVDKNKLQQHKEDMLEKLKDLEDVNLKLQDELMDATQELMIKGSDLTSAKAEMQRHRNEIDRLNEDICTLSTLCSNYKKLSPTTEFPPMQLLTPNKAPEEGDVQGILNLLKMWQAGGQLEDVRISSFMRNLFATNDNNNVERLRIYANQLEHVSRVLDDSELHQAVNYAPLQQLRQDIEIVRLNANWTQVLGEDNVTQQPNNLPDQNANGSAPSADVPQPL